MDGIQPFIIADAVANFSLDHHRQAMQYASDPCAVTITKDLLLKELL